MIGVSFMNRCIAWVLFSIFLAGCGGGGKTTLSGKVLIQGSPAQVTDGEMLQLQFLPETGSGSHMAAVDKSGNYSIITSSGNIPPGKYKVVVLSQTGTAAPQKGKAPPSDRFKGKYSKDKTPLTVTVKSGDNKEDIKLD